MHPREDKRPAADTAAEAELAALAQRFGRHVPRMLGGYGCAVLCPLIRQQEGLCLLFERRSAQVAQGGETCFPGGRMEAGEDPIACALRETQEELAIPSKEVRILGRGDFLCHHRGFAVYPVVGAVSGRGVQALHPAENEVAEVFTVPLSFFRATPPQLCAYEVTAQAAPGFPWEDLGIPPDYSFGRSRVEVPVWQYRGRVIWGMTARIVRSLLAL